MSDHSVDMDDDMESRKRVSIGIEDLSPGGATPVTKKNPGKMREDARFSLRDRQSIAEQTINQKADIKIEEDAIDGG
jgi:hypothetical protein